MGVTCSGLRRVASNSASMHALAPSTSVVLPVTISPNNLVAAATFSFKTLASKTMNLPFNVYILETIKKPPIYARTVCLFLFFIPFLFFTQNQSQFRDKTYSRDVLHETIPPKAAISEALLAIAELPNKCATPLV